MLTRRGWRAAELCIALFDFVAQKPTHLSLKKVPRSIRAAAGARHTAPLQNDVIQISDANGPWCAAAAVVVVVVVVGNALDAVARKLTPPCCLLYTSPSPRD